VAHKKWHRHRSLFCYARRREIPVADLRGEALVPRPIPHSHGASVREAMECLSEADQETLRQHFYERMSFQSMADEAGLAGRQSAHERTKAALRRLEKELEKRGVTYG